jgi:hypothetical protein
MPMTLNLDEQGERTRRVAVDARNDPLEVRKVTLASA